VSRHAITSEQIAARGCKSALARLRPLAPSPRSSAQPPPPTMEHCRPLSPRRSDATKPPGQLGPTHTGAELSWRPPAVHTHSTAQHARSACSTHAVAEKQKHELQNTIYRCGDKCSIVTGCDPASMRRIRKIVACVTGKRHFFLQSPKELRHPPAGGGSENAMHRLTCWPLWALGYISQKVQTLGCLFMLAPLRCPKVWLRMGLAYSHASVGSRLLTCIRWLSLTHMHLLALAYSHASVGSRLLTCLRWLSLTQMHPLALAYSHASVGSRLLTCLRWLSLTHIPPLALAYSHASVGSSPHGLFSKKGTFKSLVASPL
jgi:hypothetical protein